MSNAQVVIVHVGPEQQSAGADMMGENASSADLEQRLSTDAGVLSQSSGLDLHLVNRALSNFLATRSSSAEYVRSLLRDDHTHHDVVLLRLLAAVVADALPGAQPSVCMHAHGFNVPMNDAVHLQLVDGGPSTDFRVIDDLNLVESAWFYDTGLMIQPDNYRLIRRYPPTVKFYVIVDGIYRGVRLCTLSVIESLGFYPLEPTGEDPFPACRGFYTAEEAFHYLYRALHDRGILRVSGYTSSPSPPVSPLPNINPLLVPEDDAFGNHLDEINVDAQL